MPPVVGRTRKSVNKLQEKMLIPRTVVNLLSGQFFGIAALERRFSSDASRPAQTPGFHERHEIIRWPAETVATVAGNGELSANLKGPSHCGLSCR